MIMAKSTKATPIPPKNFYCEIPVAPEDVARFQKGCAHYGMSISKKPGAVCFTVGFDNIVDIYWLGANMFGRIPGTGISQQAF